MTTEQTAHTCFQRCAENNHHPYKTNKHTRKRYIIKIIKEIPYEPEPNSRT